jgi:Tfp pilus assembly protein PilV
MNRSPRGLSMIEVLLSALILSVCALTMIFAMKTSGDATKQSSEYDAAVAAARRKIEELSTTNFDLLVQRYGKYNPTVGNTFKVYLDEGVQYKDASGAKQTGIELTGLYKLVNGAANWDAGEIVIITHESNAPSTYGYSCSLNASTTFPDGGQPGGISFMTNPTTKTIAIDLDADGDTTSGNCYDLSVTPNVKTAVRLPIGVVIRWYGPHGPERYEQWTILTRY